MPEPLRALLDSLPDDQRGKFFDHLARDFSPDPKAVPATALACSQAPGHVAHLIRRTQVAEPLRQEVSRRINRARGGTAAILRLRRRFLERRNSNADLSAKGLKQSAGAMVNCLCDLARIETSHAQFVQGRVVHSRAISALL